MPLWIKICGNTSLADAQLAAEAGADALGFIFAPSPRRVSVPQAAGIIPQLPAALEKIGIFVDASIDEIATTVRTAGLTGVQLHSGIAADATAQLRAAFGPALRILHAIHFGPEAPRHAAALDANPDIDALLIDSRTPTAVGGTGIAYDWQRAAATLFPASVGHPRVAAGGLNPANVAEAIATLRPWGVDTVSGVEAAPGRKDPEKLRAFLAAARAASY